MSNTKNTPAIGSVRTLKVYDRIVCHPSPYYFSYNTATHCPEIRLMGKWLQQYGFTAGQHIQVMQEPGKLTITLAYDESED